MYYLIFSLISIILLSIIMLFSSKIENTSLFVDQLILSLLFISCCIFGLSCAFYPRWYKKLLFSTSQKKKHKKKSNKLKRKGHHPDCMQFKNHRIKVKNTFYCTGCFGLSIGLILSMIVMMIYLLHPIIFSNVDPIYLFILGIIIIFFVFLEMILPQTIPIIHLFLNALFILSFFLIIISLFMKTNTLYLAGIGILFSFLFLDTRIQLSNRKHRNICQVCDESCKMYK